MGGVLMGERQARNASVGSPGSPKAPLRMSAITGISQIQIEHCVALSPASRSIKPLQADTGCKCWKTAEVLNSICHLFFPSFQYQSDRCRETFMSLFIYKTQESVPNPWPQFRAPVSQGHDDRLTVFWRSVELWLLCSLRSPQQPSQVSHCL